MSVGTLEGQILVAMEDGIVSQCFKCGWDLSDHWEGICPDPPRELCGSCDAGLPMKCTCVDPLKKEIKLKRLCLPININPPEYYYYVGVADTWDDGGRYISSIMTREFKNSASYDAMIAVYEDLESQWHAKYDKEPNA